MKVLFWLGLCGTLAVDPPGPKKTTRLVAVGDSITSGEISLSPWPAQLFGMLGSNTQNFEVLNHGVSGRTMMKVTMPPHAPSA
jgi:hypothetical protein